MKGKAWAGSLIGMLILAGATVLTGCELFGGGGTTDSTVYTVSGNMLLDMSLQWIPYGTSPPVDVSDGSYDVYAFAIEPQSNPEEAASTKIADAAAGYMKKSVPYQSSAFMIVPYDYTLSEKGDYWLIYFMDVNGNGELDLYDNGAGGSGPAEPYAAYPFNQTGPTATTIDKDLSVGVEIQTPYYSAPPTN